MLERGAKSPSFTLPTDDGHFNLADHHGKKMVVFFFPRADTSGCTKEAIAFSALRDEFAAANCEVIGISKDSAAKQAKFRAKHGLIIVFLRYINCGVWLRQGCTCRRFQAQTRSITLTYVECQESS